MDFLVVLVAAVIGTLVLRRALHRVPWLFYLLAVVADAAYVAGMEGFLPRAAIAPLTMLLGKCMLSLALFVIVMYIGVFARDSRAYRSLALVRAELSIVACILAAGHMAVYMASYFPRLGFALDGNVVASLVVALALLALLLVLGVTSLACAKKRMSKASWKAIQRWAYVFFGLAYVHLLLMLAPAASKGGLAAQESIIVYSVVFVGYAVLRLTRAVSEVRFARETKAQVNPSSPLLTDEVEIA